METLAYLAEEKELLQTTNKPIIIWGTKIAGKIAYGICKKLNIMICAFGDNDERKQGMKFFDIEIVSMEEVVKRYPTAIIIIASFIYDSWKAVQQQLTARNENFVIISRTWTEYYYELFVMKRNVVNRESYLLTLEDVFSNKDIEWRFEANHEVISEYRYIVTDYEFRELFDMIYRGYKIKYLYLIVAADYLGEAFLRTVYKLQSHSSIGHVILVTEGCRIVCNSLLEKFKNYFFYIIVSDKCNEEFIEQLNVSENYYELENLSDDLFDFPVQMRNDVITEKVICDTVYSYISKEGQSREKWADEKVYIVQLFNGLANQMLMYMFGKILERESGRRVIFDNTILALDILDKDVNIHRVSKWLGIGSAEKAKSMVSETRKRNSFYYYKRAEVAEVFSLPIRLLSDYFEDDIWYLYLNKVKKEFIPKCAQPFPIGQLLLKKGMDITIMQDKQIPGDFLAVKNCFIFNTYILELPYQAKSLIQYIFNNDRNTYYMGVWTMGKVKDWLYTNRRLVKESFKFHIKYTERIYAYVEKIRSTEAVMVHIRRGDFVVCNWASDNNYFKASIQTIEKIESKDEKHYFIFSDDIDWCIENGGLLGLSDVKDRVTYVIGNEGKNSYIDMYLMTLGKILVPSYNSTFGYMALLLSENIERCADAVQYEYHRRIGINDKVEIIEVV